MKKFALIAAFSVSLPAFASPGGSDMCGLGWQVTQKKSFLATSTRGTTNVFVPPTFGMTSGTIGCDQHSIARENPEAADFMLANFENLRIEMASGSGENLTAFAEILGCSDPAAFGARTRENYRTIMESGFEDAMQAFEKVMALKLCSRDA